MSEHIKSKLIHDKNSNQIIIYFGKPISSTIFNGQLTQTQFNDIESKLKQSCKLTEVPYGLYNEYCYDNYTYHTNTKSDRLYSQQINNIYHVMGQNQQINVKINHVKLIEEPTFNFNVQQTFNHIQPFMEGSLKIGNQIFIKLRKNLYTYDITSPISSYQVYIIYKGEKNKNDLLTKIISDIIH